MEEPRPKKKQRSQKPQEGETYHTGICLYYDGTVNVFRFPANEKKRSANTRTLVNIATNTFWNLKPETFIKDFEYRSNITISMHLDHLNLDMADEIAKATKGPKFWNRNATYLLYLLSGEDR